MEDQEKSGADQTNRVLLLPSDKNDGNVSAIFSEDKLELRADFYPPMAGGKPLSVDYIASALNRLKVIHGILWENIQEAVTSCNLNHRIVHDVVIARGNPPVSEILEYYQINPNLKAPEPEPQGNDRVDHRAYSPFIIVKKDQALAKLKSRKAGKEGRDIYGTVLPYGTRRPEGVSAGANTRSDGTFIYAAINGQLVADNGVLNVQDSLVIKGPVDYRTGHIIFPGDVEIEGPVSDGFKIYSGGAVTIKQTFDVTDVITKTDLTVLGGIIGRGRALVKVGGSLKTKFIENCKVASRRTITVDVDIVNSSVFTLERLEMGDKGKILGGEIYAVQGIRAGGIGKKTGKATRIHCGVDFTAQQEKEKCNYQMRILSAKLNKLRNLMETEAELPPSPDQEERRKKMEEALARFEEEQKKLAGQITAILGRLNAFEEAAVEVSGEIAPGTLIEICQIALFVSEPLRHVRIRLDRGLGKLVSEGL
ncbi:MAG: FapA family protein [Spirochaetaceae bacterium]|jgi:uncharacterized protein (DUF342 family)|nr:FapA family protein [Spirochaetaceae bacterium]